MVERHGTLFQVRKRTRSRVADSDSIGSVDPDPDSESVSGSGSRRAKITHKSRKFFLSSCFEELDGFF
jgi:hypothetical protein